MFAPESLDTQLNCLIRQKKERFHIELRRQKNSDLIDFNRQKRLQ
jgi:hypothetical protein